MVPFDQLFGGGFGSPTKMDYRNKTSGALILTSLLEDLAKVFGGESFGEPVPETWKRTSRPAHFRLNYFLSLFF